MEKRVPHRAGLRPGPPVRPPADPGGDPARGAREGAGDDPGRTLLPAAHGARHPRTGRRHAARPDHRRRLRRPSGGPGGPDHARPAAFRSQAVEVRSGDPGPGDLRHRAAPRPRRGEPLHHPGDQQLLGAAHQSDPGQADQHRRRVGGGSPRRPPADAERGLHRDLHGGGAVPGGRRRPGRRSGRRPGDHLREPGPHRPRPPAEDPPRHPRRVRVPRRRRGPGRHAHLQQPERRPAGAGRRRAGAHRALGHGRASHLPGAPADPRRRRPAPADDDGAVEGDRPGRDRPEPAEPEHPGQGVHRRLRGLRALHPAARVLLPVDARERPHRGGAGLGEPRTDALVQPLRPRAADLDLARPAGPGGGAERADRRPHP